jgi:hypothetical protein
MKTIHQLASLARRIPRVRRRCLHKLSTQQHIQTTEQERLGYRMRLRALPAAERLLASELALRRVGMPGIDCALPLKKQRQILTGNSRQETKLLVGQKLA